jgi:ribonuclease VapC
MMLDSSAIVAILLREPGCEGLVEKIAAAQFVAVGTPTLFETAMVLTIKTGRDGLAMVNDFLQEMGIIVATFSQEHVGSAYQAYIKYGKGRHPAALNMGDCFSYAAAQLSGQPLLFKRADFAQTDVKAA